MGPPARPASRGALTRLPRPEPRPRTSLNHAEPRRTGIPFHAAGKGQSLGSWREVRRIPEPGTSLGLSPATPKSSAMSHQHFTYNEKNHIE